MKRLTHLSLFSGIGGLDLAAEWAGMQTIGQCEWAEYPTKVLEKHWPDVPRWKDIRTLTGESFYERTGRRTVDIISGGFPCQPFSTAGKQRGKEDDRYLWPEMVRVIKELRPTWIVGENVAGIVKMALPDILSELEACGYRTRTFLVPACAVGARHRRYRVAIVAYSYAERELQSARNKQDIRNGSGISRKTLAYSESQFEGRLPGRKEKEKPGFVIGCKNVGYSEHNGLSSAEIDGGTQKTGGGKQEGKKETGEFAGTGEPRNSQDVGRTEDVENSGCYGFGKQRNVCEQPGRTESERTGETLANTAGERLEGTTGTKLQGKRHGFTASDKDVSDTGNRSRDVRRLSAIEEAERTGCDIGGRAQEHEPRERWTAESVLGGVADGISSGVDGNLDFIINHFWDEEPDIPRIATGIDHRCDRLKCLGNAVVPQQFYPIFKAIVQAEQTKGERRWSD